MLKAYKYRLYPNKEQRIRIDAAMNACRLIYNLGLEIKIKAYRDHGITVRAYTLGRDIKDLRKDFPWIADVNSSSLHNKLNDLDVAYRNFFRGGGFPKFKKKSGVQSYSFRESIRLNQQSGLISIPKIKKIKISISRTFDGIIKNATISRSSTGKYFCSLLVENTISIPATLPIRNAIGIDMGLKSFATLSNGDRIDNPKYLTKSKTRLGILQKRLSKKKKGSCNRKKAIQKVALLHERISNQRKDFLHKTSSTIVNNSQVDTICIETLTIKNMVKNHSLALHISDASWAEFTRQLEYKCTAVGKSLLKIGMFEPSSKTCSSCGLINSSLILSDREWTCECGVVHDRDINAAINIKQIALAGRGTPGEPVELRTVVRA